MSRDETLHEIGRRRVSAIIRARDQALAREAMKAAVAGGFRTIEFTLTTPNALRLIEEFARDDELLVGAGTVLGLEQARDAVAAGARFLVSPVASPQIIAAAASLDAVSVPGVFTPNEMVTAQMYGADILKLFPSPGDVAEYISAVLGPLPHLRIFPTAGITPLNFVEILSAGAFGVGFTKSLFEAEDMAGRNFKAIERRAADLMERLPG